MSNFEKLKKEVTEILKKQGYDHRKIYGVVGVGKSVEPLRNGVKFDTMVEIYNKQGQGALLTLMLFANEVAKMKGIGDE